MNDSKSLYGKWLEITKHPLVGGFNPSEKYQSNWIISPKRDENIKSLKPPPSISHLQQVQQVQHLKNLMLDFPLGRQISVLFGVPGISMQILPILELGLQETKLRDADAREEVAQYANELWQANVP